MTARLSIKHTWTQSKFKSASLSYVVIACTRTPYVALLRLVKLTARQARILRMNLFRGITEIIYNPMIDLDVPIYNHHMSRATVIV